MHLKHALLYLIICIAFLVESIDLPESQQIVLQILKQLSFQKKRLATSICKINRVFSKSDLPRKVAKEEKSLSPSDFGFHNMLIDKNGRLRFIDFEYAGWDDPAKIICDFFCQPKFPVPMNWMDSFIEEALG